MDWRFQLYDRLGNFATIEEPQHWEKFTLRLKRHPERHGTFRELQGNSFEFTGLGADILRTEYEQYGVRGQVDMTIEGNCAGQGWVLLYRGRVAFDEYAFTCDEEGCKVSIGLDQLGPLVAFINRFDQKVDVTSLTAHDGVTALTDYATLQRDLLLPSKAIKLRGISSNSSMVEYVLSDDSGFQAAFGGGFGGWSEGVLQGLISVPFQETAVNAIKDYFPSTITDFFNDNILHEYTPEIIYNNPDQSLNCLSSSIDIDFRVKGVFKSLTGGPGAVALHLYLRRGDDTIGTSSVIDESVVTIRTGVLAAFEDSFDHSYTGTVSLAPDEKLWLNFILTFDKGPSWVPDMRIQFDAETRFSAAILSKCDPTTARVFLLNETLSRVTEAITDGKMRVISSLYGRTDSLPYAMPVNGCAGLRVVTPGLNIRNAKLANGGAPKFFLSMKEAFEALSAIDNIGIGAEGARNIRIENWKYFYQDHVVHSCTNIEKLEKRIKADNYYAIFRNGYDKWEAEDFNGLDEFLTTREWRTSLTQVNNALEKKSKWIASGYAWEVTRRKQNDTKDWRFDNDTFILCLTNQFSGAMEFNPLGLTFDNSQGNFQAGDSITIVGENGVNYGTYTVTAASAFGIDLAGFTPTGTPIFGGTVSTSARTWVELGNFVSPANILDPATVYNFRLSPARNAMRWFDWISAGYRHVDSSDSLQFASGDGNYLAAGRMVDQVCQLEADVLTESPEIRLSDFADPEAGRAIAFAERVVFSYPLGLADYRKLADAPYGLVEYTSGCEAGSGWIDELEYNPEDGLAKFTIIPKITP